MNWLLDASFYVIPFLLIFTLVTFIHELGHFWIARRNKIAIQVFSIGFGPEIFGYTDQLNTRWRLSAIPLGGYVLIDEDSAESQDNEPKKTPWQHFCVSVAGPLSNYLSAVILLGGIYAMVGRPESPLMVRETVKDSPAAAAGILSGDVITHVNATPITTFRELRNVLGRGIPDAPISIRLLRDEETIEMRLVPAYTEKNNVFGFPVPVFSIGVFLAEGKIQTLSCFTALWYGLKDVYIMSADMAAALGGIFVGTQPVGTLGGPVRIAEMVGEISKSGSWTHILLFIVTLSVNLGLVNLFPFPGLDGGTAALCLFECVFGRPLSNRVREVIGYFGFVIIGMLMALSLGNDLWQMSIFQKLWRFLGF
ncbi:MAG: M50 family metallopeptidase [Holosporales bacterium]|jgi:regulator of sigma E protease|nr:M50 family metallopeptidase [Holosporales bacterium]